MHIVERWAVLPILALVVTLSGCGTATMSLSPRELQTIRIERVDVDYKPDARIQWERVEVPYVERMKGEYQTIINSPKGKRYMQSVLTTEIKKRVGAAIVPKFQGTRPVVLEITVRWFRVPSSPQGRAPVLEAVTRLKDASTGKELARLEKRAYGHCGVPDIMVTGGYIGGPPTAASSYNYSAVVVNPSCEDFEDRLFRAYIQNLSNWLQTNSRT
jgi:hypothetical protein